MRRRGSKRGQKKNVSFSEWLRPKRPFFLTGKRRYYAAIGVVVIGLGSIMVFGYKVGEETDIAPDDLVMRTDPDQQALQREIKKMVKGYPIERMAGEISRQDKMVAAYLVSIAKKESNWGKRVPHYQGKDCYNYWGYRDPDNALGTGGHTCFDSPQEAVKTVGERIHSLVYEEQRTTPSKMIVWKCGYSCASHSEESVRKWKTDVSYYFHKLIPL